jgi:hypothetical protein
MQSEMVEVPQDILLWATHYALNRNDYIASHVAAQILLNWLVFSDSFREVLAREIYAACMDGTVPHEMHPKWRQIYSLVDCLTLIRSAP